MIVNAVATIPKLDGPPAEKPQFALSDPLITIVARMAFSTLEDVSQLEKGFSIDKLDNSIILYQKLRELEKGAAIAPHPLWAKNREALEKAIVTNIQNDLLSTCIGDSAYYYEKGEAPKKIKQILARTGGFEEKLKMISEVAIERWCYCGNSKGELLDIGETNLPKFLSSFDNIKLLLSFASQEMKDKTMCTWNAGGRFAITKDCHGRTREAWISIARDAGAHTNAFLVDVAPPKGKIFDGFIRT